MALFSGASVSACAECAAGRQAAARLGAAQNTGAQAEEQRAKEGLIMSTSAADRPLARLVRRAGQPAHLCAALDLAQRRVRTVGDLLVHTDEELVCLLDLYLPEVRALVMAASRAVATPRTAAQLLAPQARDGQVGQGHFTQQPHPAAQQEPLLAPCLALPTGVSELDRHLGGGLPMRALCELVGPAGVGKTQCCLSMAARALVDGSARGARVLYVDTEGSFSATRLLELVRHQIDHSAPLQRPSSACAPSSHGVPEASFSSFLPAAAAPEDLLARVTVLRPASWAQCTTCIRDQLQAELMRSPDGALVVVDSIASAVRDHFEGGGNGSSAEAGGGVSELARRQQAVGALAARLKFYADTYGACVVCVNQVSGGGGREGAYGAAQRGDVGAVQGRDDGALLAYLGTAWAHYVNVRLVLQYPRFTAQLPAPPPTGMLGPTQPRSMRLRVAKAPMAECEAEFEYRVMGAGGVVGETP